MVENVLTRKAEIAKHGKAPDSSHHHSYLLKEKSGVLCTRGFKIQKIVFFPNDIPTLGVSMTTSEWIILSKFRDYSYRRIFKESLTWEQNG